MTQHMFVTTVIITTTTITQWSFEDRQISQVFRERCSCRLLTTFVRINISGCDVNTLKIKLRETLHVWLLNAGFEHLMTIYFVKMRREDITVTTFDKSVCLSVCLTLPMTNWRSSLCSWTDTGRQILHVERRQREESDVHKYEYRTKNVVQRKLTATPESVKIPSVQASLTVLIKNQRL